MKKLYYISLVLWILTLFGVGRIPDNSFYFFHLFTLVFFLISRFFYMREKKKKETEKPQSPNTFKSRPGNNQTKGSNSRTNSTDTAVSHDKIAQTFTSDSETEKELREQKQKQYQQKLEQKKKEYEQKLQQQHQLEIKDREQKRLNEEKEKGSNSRTNSTDTTVSHDKVAQTFTSDGETEKELKEQKQKQYQQKLQQKKKEYEQKLQQQHQLEVKNRERKRQLEIDNHEQNLQNEEKEIKVKQTHTENSSVSEMNHLLLTASKHLFPGGRVLAELGGQRQLLVWLCAGIPCLRELPNTSAGSALMDPDLPDDPEDFLPCLDDVVSEALSLLSEKYDGNWAGLNPEALTGAWFALRMYAKMSADPEIFLAAADDIAAYMQKSPEMMAWLRKQTD